MSPKLRKILSFLFITLSVVAVFCIAFANEELSDAWSALRHLDTHWLLVLLGCWAAYGFLTRWELGFACAGRVSA